MYIIDAKKFCLQELVWKNIYNYYKSKGQLWVLWRKFDPNFLKTLEKLHDVFGTAVVNNWHFKNPVSWLGDQIFEHSGARPVNVISLDEMINPFVIFTPKKMWGDGTTHCDWNTGDVKFKMCAVPDPSKPPTPLKPPLVPPSQGDLNDFRDLKKKKYDAIRKFIIDNPEIFPYITVIESGEYAPTWLHFSTGNFGHDDGTVRIVKP